MPDDAQPLTTQTLLDGLAFPECPRWHDGALWFSDQHEGTVWRVEPGGQATAVLTVPGGPGGLGWAPDGAMLVVSMGERLLLRVEGHGPIPVADMSAWHPGLSNDMVVSSAGISYVGNIGYDYHQGDKPRPTVLTAVNAAGEVSVAAEDVFVPNGMVITPDGATLILAESMGHRLTAFDIGPDGALSGRRIFADLGREIPDGICLDADGGVWYGWPSGREVVRVIEGGTVTDRISTGGRFAVAPTLGGPDGRTLFVCTSGHLLPPETVENRTGRIEYAQVKVPGAGW